MIWVPLFPKHSTTLASPKSNGNLLFNIAKRTTPIAQTSAKNGSVLQNVSLKIISFVSNNIFFYKPKVSHLGNFIFIQQNIVNVNVSISHLQLFFIYCILINQIINFHLFYLRFQSTKPLKLSFCLKSISKSNDSFIKSLPLKAL